MVLRRDAPVDRRPRRAVVGPVGHGRAEAAVRLPRVPHAVRPAGGGARRPHRGARRRRRRGAGGRGRAVPIGRRRRPTALASPTVLDVAAAWAGAPGRSALAGLAVVLDPATASVGWIPAACLDDRGVQRRSTDGRPVRAHQAKALMRGLAGVGIDLRSLQLDTAIAAYLIDPAENRYDLADLLGRYTGDSLPADGAPDGPARPRRRAPSTTPLSAARAGAGRQPAGAGARGRPRQAGHARALRRDREPARRRAGPHGGGRHRRRRRRAARASTTASRRSASAWPARCTRSPGASSTSTRRRSCARSCSTSAACRRRSAPRPASPPTPSSLEKLRDQWPEFIDPLLPYREVEKLRSTYGEGLLAEVAPDGRIHATFNQTVARTGRLSSRPAEPAQHPGALRGGPPVPPGVRARRRATCCWSPTTTRSSCAASPTSPRTPGLIAAFTERQDIHNATASRIFGVEPDRRHHRPAVEGEDGVVRAGLRHGGLRARAAAEHPDRGGGRDPRRRTSSRSRT